MAKMEFDTVDAALVVTGLASAFMLVGIATFQLFDVDFGATQFTLSGSASRPRGCSAMDRSSGPS